MKHLTFLKALAFCLAFSVSGHSPAQTASASEETDMLDFPYVWGASSLADFSASGDSPTWTGMQDYFWLMGQKNTWPGKTLTSKTISFPEQGEVLVSFMYNASDTVKIVLLGKTPNDGNIDTLNSVIASGTGSQYGQIRMTFEAGGPRQILFQAELKGGQGNNYGSIKLTEINFKPSGYDLAAIAVLEPGINRLPTKNRHFVKARFENLSPFDILNPIFSYKTGETIVEEVYEGTVKANSSIDYTFKTPYIMPEATQEPLSVWCHFEEDKDLGNDTVETGAFVYYTPYDFPYYTGFGDGFNHWTIIDDNQDGYTWQFVVFGGEEQVADTMLGYAWSYGTYNDYAIAPAIYMPQGLSRLSYYYAGAGGNGHLKVLKGYTPNLSDMKIIWEEDVTDAGWKNAYTLFEIPADTLCYFAFHITGGSDQVLVDKISIDRHEDLCMNDITFDTKSGFHKDRSKVTISYINHGMTPQKDITVRYCLNDLSDYVEETVTETVEPGDTLYYIFHKEADISTPGKTYRLIGQIMTKVGFDTYNDAAYGQSLTHYKELVPPYANDFSDEIRQAQWLFSTNTPETGWRFRIAAGGEFGGGNTYTGSHILYHDNKGDVQADSWAYSECLDLKAGEYDIAFFYRTLPGWTGDDYKQNFGLMLGTDTLPESMTDEIVRYENVLVPGFAFKKFTGKLHIEKDGSYYLGFHNTSPANAGSTIIDLLTIDPVTEGLPLPYQSDFTHHADEWYYYNPSNYIRWNTLCNGNDSILHVSRPDSSIWYGEGLLVSPKLHLEPGTKVSIKITYAMSANKDSIALNLYTGHTNNPDALSVATVLGQTGSYRTYEHAFTSTEADSVFYIGLRSNIGFDVDLATGFSYEIALRSITIVAETPTETLETQPQPSVFISGGTLFLTGIEDGNEVSLFSLNGRELQTVHYASTGISLAGLPAGLYLIRIKALNKTLKFVYR